MGGHVTQHIYGMTPPSGSSQKDKTLFKSRGNYDAAWRQYGYIDNPVACSGNSKFRWWFGKALHMGKIDAYSCKQQADGQGVTRWDTYMAKEISYGFVLKDGKWILNTLYPVPRLGRRPSAPAAPLQQGRGSGQKVSVPRPMPGSLKPERPSSMRPLKRRRKLSDPAR